MADEKKLKNYEELIDKIYHIINSGKIDDTTKIELIKGQLAYYNHKNLI